MKLPWGDPEGNEAPALLPVDGEWQAIPSHWEEPLGVGSGALAKASTSREALA